MGDEAESACEWREGKPLPLAGKSFEILAFLIAHRDRVVTKDDLLSEIWPGTFVQENNLVRHVSTLRKVLDQRPDHHDYVLTVQGRGYRWRFCRLRSGTSSWDPATTASCFSPRASRAQR